MRHYYHLLVRVRHVMNNAPSSPVARLTQPDDDGAVSSVLGDRVIQLPADKAALDDGARVRTFVSHMIECHLCFCCATSGRAASM